MNLYIKIKNQKIFIKEASTFWQRFFGLSYKSKSEYGLLFQNAKAIHTFGMLFSIDVFCLNGKNELIYHKKNLKPFRIFIAPKGSISIIEIPTALTFLIEDIDFESINE